jgi:energy-coupling factor transporter ATP-binding protein EcfA2
MGVSKSWFLSDEDYWGNDKTNVFLKCDKCFPKNIDAMKPCMPSCIYTEHGYGVPPVIKYIFENKIPVPPSEAKPTFVVAYGPPGSGKSSILEVLSRTLANEFPSLDASHTIEVNVDRIFQEGPFGEEYKSARKATESKGPLYTQRLYMYYRWIADQISDSVLNLALLGRFNILWETTGETIHWTRREISRIKSLNYQVILVLPIVGEDEILARLKRRAEQTGQEAAPAKQIEHKIDQSLRNLIDLLSDKQCPDWIIDDLLLKIDTKSCSPDRVIIYNNQLPDGKQEILFDSDSPNKYKDNLNKSITKLVKNEQFIQYFQKDRI